MLHFRPPTPTMLLSRVAILVMLAWGIATFGERALTAPVPSAGLPPPRNNSSAEAAREARQSAAVGLWAVTGSMNEARGQHTATLLPDGKVLVAGGTGAATALASAELYDPVTRLWSFTGSLASPRSEHTATPLTNGKVLVVGGRNLSVLPTAAELYDPATGTWSPAGNISTRRSDHTATLLQNGNVIVVGGSGQGGNLSSVELYNSASNTWTLAAQLNDKRSFHTATILSDGRVMVVGGHADDTGGPLLTTEVYDSGANTWTRTGNLTTGRAQHRAALLGNGKVLVAGGKPANFLVYLSSAELYDPVANSWTATASMHFPRTNGTITSLQDGRALMAGSFFDAPNTAEVYDHISGTWTDTPGLRSDRRVHTATLLQNGEVLVAGGWSARDSYPTAELYIPTAIPNAAGPRIVFAKNFDFRNHEIYTMQIDGTDETRLTNSLAYDDHPKWSPDRSKIVFMSDRDGNFEIYTMNPDGTAQTRITNNFAGDGFPAWSPDGSKIAFVRGDLRNPSTFEIYVMNADGSNQIQLTTDVFIDGVPDWSPDGSKIVFMSGGSSVFQPNSFEIYVMNADGNNRTRLTNNNIVDGQPSYSPDGTKILFAAGDGFNPNGIEIFVMNADGSNRVQLTSNTVTDGFPAWSFDGSQIVFASGSIADDGNTELFVMNANGSNRAKLTANWYLDWFPDWEPVQTPASQLQFSTASSVAGEGSSSVVLTVSRIGNTTGMAAVSYVTIDNSGANNCNVIGSFASRRCDYEPRAGTLNFAPGETSKTIPVFLVDDSYDENDETFLVVLSNASGSGVGLGSNPTTTITITDNDSANGANPIDNAGFFVRQHYIDFLNREPDSAGLAFWTNQITSCGTDQACIEIRRINVSAAFFVSVEFQETGFVVYRLYKAAHNPPGTPVPVRYDEFMSDTQQIGQGVIVGVGNWQAQLDANKQSFLADFVLRPRFTGDHPISRTPTQFVDALYTNAGVTPSASDRTAAINEFGGAPNTADTAARARALRRVAQNAILAQQEFNKAFVLMQYFGYLRRNPFDPPEPTLNFDGYNFWLNKLNQFNGNYINAELVKAFITSGEYRQRFGP